MVWRRKRGESKSRNRSRNVCVAARDMRLSMVDFVESEILLIAMLRRITEADRVACSLLNNLHLSLQGWQVFTVNPFSWNSMYLADSVARQANRVFTLHLTTSYLQK